MKAGSNLDRAKEMFTAISNSIHDDEGAHEQEDKLRAFALYCVANEDPDAKQIVGIALQTDELNFCRYYA